MKTSIGAGGLALTSAALLLSACAPYYYGYDRYGYYYGYNRYGYYGSPYAYSSSGCYGPYQPSYCFPTFSGTVVIAGMPYQNLRYRDGPGGREYWFDGHWVHA